MSKIRSNSQNDTPTGAQKQPGGAATKLEIDLFTKKISQKIGQDPKKAASILTDWVKRSIKETRKKAG